jgi:glutamate-1-semialdehyde 2,1-aminomutase
MDRNRLGGLLAGERQRFSDLHPRSGQAFAAARHLFGGVPMTWMNMRAGAFPLYLDTARGACVTDIDGISYADFSLGDTAAMAGHSPAATVSAVMRRFGELGGATAMMPTEDAEWVGAELTRRFGCSRWSLSLTATDANRWAIRIVRAVTGRPKILVNSYCYHGSVDESLIVAEFNDLPGLERQLAHGDVAAVLMEPALTNIGIVLPEPGYLAGVRELTRRHGTVLIIDETHTFSAGPGGCCRAWGLEPDLVVIGKAIGGGIPAGAFGMTAELADRVLARTDLDLIDMGGVGGTMAGSALSVAAVRATLEHVLTDAAFAQMTTLATRYAAGVADIFAAHGAPWSVSQLGARAEYRFIASPPRTGTESNRAGDPELDDYFHLYLANRGVLLTPFHNMALMCPQTTAGQVDTHLAVLGDAVAELLPPG